MRRHKGFTLVELLVVIGIIAVLIGILLPTLSNVRTRANSIKCEANLADIGRGLLMYVNDNRQKIPHAEPTPYTPNYYFDGTTTPWPSIVTVLAAYSKPGYPTVLSSGLPIDFGTTYFGESTTSVWRCPADHFMHPAAGTPAVVKPRAANWFDRDGLSYGWYSFLNPPIAGIRDSSGNITTPDQIWYSWAQIIPNMKIYVSDRITSTSQIQVLSDQDTFHKANTQAQKKGAQDTNYLWGDGHVGPPKQT